MINSKSRQDNVLKMDSKGRDNLQLGVHTRNAHINRTSITQNIRRYRDQSWLKGCDGNPRINGCVDQFCSKRCTDHSWINGCDGSSRLKRCGGQFRGKFEVLWTLLYKILVISIISHHIRHCCTHAAISENVDPPRLLEDPPLSFDVCYISSGIVLPCRTSGHPAPRITWYKDTIEFDATKHVGARVEQDGSLHLSVAVKQSNSHILGIYQCRVDIEGQGSVLSNESSVYTTEIPDRHVRTGPTREINYSTGQPLLLSCLDHNRYWMSLLGVPGVIVYWEKNSQQPQCLAVRQAQGHSDTTKCTQALNGSLALLYTDASDADAVYHCRIEYPRCHDKAAVIVSGLSYNLKPATQSANMNVGQPLFLYASAASLVVLQHQEIKMQCIFGEKYNDQLPRISWYGPGRQQLVGSQISEGGRVLTISRALDKIHTGQYICEASYHDSSSTLSRKIDVIVEEPASISHPLQDQWVVFNGTARFQLRAKGRPKPTITWFINSTKLTDTPSNSSPVSVSVQSLDGGSTFIMSGLEYNTSITCEISNTHQKTVHNAHIYVLSSSAASALSNKHITDPAASDTTAAVKQHKPEVNTRHTRWPSSSSISGAILHSRRVGEDDNADTTAHLDRQDGLTNTGNSSSIVIVVSGVSVCLAAGFILVVLCVYRLKSQRVYAVSETLTDKDAEKNLIKQNQENQEKAAPLQVVQRPIVQPNNQGVGDDRSDCDSGIEN